MNGGVDFDWIVVGSGFGGSVSALRLAERGYSVCVLECGRRFADDELPRSGWKLRDYLWAPQVGLRGILRMSVFRDLAIVSGSGVGGGSLVYAATLYRAVPEFQTRMAAVCREPVDLGPHYEEAERMLGVVENDHISVRDEALRDLASDHGYGDRWHPSRVGIFRGVPGTRVPDPFFGGEGPERSACIDCGACMVGCRHGAKNTLEKNYLWFAERHGVQIVPDREVTDIRPLGAEDGADGYAVVTQRPGARLGIGAQVLRARGVVVAAGAVGTNRLLGGCQARGSLPRISAQLGQQVRTNAESICALTARDPKAHLSAGVTIGSSAWPSAGMHLEPFSYGDALDAMNLLFVPLTPDGTRVTRPLKLVANVLRRPREAAVVANPRGWGGRSMGIGAMEAHDGTVRFVTKPRRLGRGLRMTARVDPENPIKAFMPELYETVQLLATKLDAIPQTMITEALFDKAFTAHILGGAVIGATPVSGVIDSRHRIHGYRNLLVCDGSAVPGNPGVNPSLTITAMAERAMTFVRPPDPGPTAPSG